MKISSLNSRLSKPSILDDNPMSGSNSLYPDAIRMGRTEKNHPKHDE